MCCKNWILGYGNQFIIDSAYISQLRLVLGYTNELYDTSNQLDILS